MLDPTYLALFEAGRAMGIQVARQSDRIVAIKIGEKTFYVYDYSWPLNVASSYLLAQDKAETHKCLSEKGIVSVPQASILGSGSRPIDALKSFLDEHGSNIVLKPNFGSQGVGITFCSSWEELQSVFPAYLVRIGSVNCSKKMDIANEYRCVVLAGQVQFIYQKNRPYVLGNGESPIISLLASSQFKFLKLKKELFDKLYTVPKSGKKIILSEQDNLSLGASPTILSQNDSLFEQLSDIAVASAQILGLKFCAVDIILEKNGNLVVMEVNSGIMFDAFISFSDENRKMATMVFQRSLALLKKEV